MSLHTIKVPDIGGVANVEVIEVLVQEGDNIDLDQTLLLLESDKASIELPCNVSGILKKLHVKVGDKVSEGSEIALIDTEISTVANASPEPIAPAVEVALPMENPKPEAAVVTVSEEPATTVTEIVSSNKLIHASPAIRRFARELGVDLTLLTQATGRKGRILKEDVQKYVKQRLTVTESIAPTNTTNTGIPPIPTVDFAKFGEIEEVKLSKIKRLTGQHLTRVWLNLPLVTYHDEADISEMEAFRNQLNADKNAPIKLTGLVFIIKALVATLKQYPRFNSSLSPDGERLILKKYFNIGIAVDTPEGLVVPVLRNVDQKGLYALSTELTEISAKARKGELKPIDMQGGCITISSLGGIGGTAFTPIVNAPEVAILGVTRSAMKPVWNGQAFIPKLMLPLDLTYDHRVIDGAEGARFMTTLCQYLTDVRRLLL